jgi:SMI1 / KNR4 family (SUKH-1)
MPTSDPWNQILEYWLQSNLERRLGASGEDIAAFETKYDVVLPPDFRKYLLLVDGSSDGDMDNCYYRFWPLAEIKPVSEELDDSGGVIYSDRFGYPDCFVFADHLINSWLYAVKITKDPAQLAPVFRVTASETVGEQLAPSFLEFMTKYANDPASIL